MLDIYFESNYGKLYETVENGESIVFEYESQHGKIKHIFIKREIPTLINDELYYDIVTPYGYGGPIIVDATNISEIVTEFELAFKKYCLENNIVSEFIRFHPIVENYSDFERVYDTTYLRNTVGTNMEYEEVFATEFSKSTRKTIRRSLRDGITYETIENPTNLKSFMDVYYSTMDRNKATDYYYFDKKYFNDFLKYFNDKLLLVNVKMDDEIIASSLNLIGNNILHVHLSGTLTEYIKYSPAYIIKYATVEWAKDQQIDVIHYGGGTTNGSEDSLFKFKKIFGQNTEFEFHIGKKVWNEEIYDLLCSENNIDKSIEFFPAYRYNGE